MSLLITSVLNCASDRLAISSSLSCIFSEALKCSVIWAIFFFFFFLSWRVCYFKGRSLRCSPGRGKAGHCALTLYVGEGPRGSNGTRSTLHRIAVTRCATHNQTGPLWCWFLSGWACAHSRPLWVSPTTSPVRLESLLLLPQPPRAFSIRGLRLYFPELEPWVAWSASLPTICLVYLCTNVGPWGATRRSAFPVLRHSESGPLGLSVRECGATGSASGRTACPISPTLLQSGSCHGHLSPLRSVCPSPPLLPVWMNVYFLFPWCRTSLLFDFLSVLVV